MFKSTFFLLIIVIVFKFDYLQVKSPTTNLFSKHEQCFIVKQMYLVERLAEIVYDAILEDVGRGDEVLKAWKC